MAEFSSSFQVGDQWYDLPYVTDQKIRKTMESWGMKPTHDDVINHIRMNRTQFRFGSIHKIVVIEPIGWQKWAKTNWDACDRIITHASLEDAELQCEKLLH